MRKLLTTAFVARAFVCLLAVSVSASTVYKDESGTELFKCEVTNGWEINSYEILNGGFAKVDGEGNALTWYLVKTETVDADTVKTVKAVKTSEVFVNGSYTNGVDKSVVVSANFDEGLTTICAFGAYSGACHEILFVYIPDSVTTLPDRFMQNGSALFCEIGENSQLTKMPLVGFYYAKNIRHIYFPSKVTEISFKSGHEFAVGASRLESVEFAKDSVISVIPHGTFNACSSLKRVTLPDSVTSVQSRVFQNCSSLEYLKFGANFSTMEKTDNDHSLTFCAASLKTVVIPYTFLAENIGDNLSYCFRPSWGETSQITFYFTGTEAQFKALQAKFDTAGNNKEIVDASIENGRLVLVDHCETYYGTHQWKGEYSAVVDSYFEAISIKDSCARCPKTEVKSTIDALFESLGYSACTYTKGLSITQGFKVNSSAIEAYKAYAPDFTFGVLATVNSEGEAYAPSLESENVVSKEFAQIVNDYIDIKVTGIPADKADAIVVLCAYVKVGGKTLYLDAGVSGETVVGISYNEANN